MSITLSKQQELEQRLESLKTEQRLASHQLAKNNGDADALNKLLEVQAAIKTTEQALGIMSTAVRAFDDAKARVDRRAFLNEAVAARATAQAAITSRQAAASAADAAIAALGTALDNMAAASETARAAFNTWHSAARSVDASRRDPWELGLSYVHTDLHWFASVLAQKLDTVLRSRIKTHPYIQFSYSEAKTPTLAAWNAMSLDTFTSITESPNNRMQKAAADA